MSTFGQWFRSKNRDDKIPLTWICGSQIVLIESALDIVRSPYAESRSVGSWEEAAQLSLMADSTLAVLRNPTGPWIDLEAWLSGSRHVGGCHVVVVSSERSEYIRDGEIKELLPQFEILRNYRSRVVVCNDLNTGIKKNGEISDSAYWLQSIGDISPLVAEHLVARTGGDYRLARDVVKKASLFGLVRSKDIVDALVDQSAFGESFLFHLISNDKNKALIAAREIPSSDYNALISHLNWHLDKLVVLYSFRREFRTMRDAVGDDRLPNAFVVRFWEAAKLYDPMRRRQARQALAAVDDALARLRTAQERALWPGQGNGALEALVALW